MGAYIQQHIIHTGRQGTLGVCVVVGGGTQPPIDTGRLARRHTSTHTYIHNGILTSSQTHIINHTSYRREAGIHTYHNTYKQTTKHANTHSYTHTHRRTMVTTYILARREAGMHSVVIHTCGQSGGNCIRTHQTTTTPEPRMHTQHIHTYKQSFMPHIRAYIHRHWQAAMRTHMHTYIHICMHTYKQNTGLHAD